MAVIHIDGRAYEVAEGQELLRAILSLGLDLPYFCWHPTLGAVGACRQCAVVQYKDENDTRGRMEMACMLPVSDGMRLSLTAAHDFRAGIIELLMANHPHDCPVCDEGGECHLQDMTVMSGHTYRRYPFPKRTFENQDLGPCLNHEMNRCITCYRCVRFYRDYAGGKDLQALAFSNRVYFGRHTDGTLESEFSGNLAEVCPTGVFTDKSYGRHYIRKWDQQSAPSVCPHCAVGCNTLPAERYGLLRRITNRYHPEVNGYFLCDRGRYGYEFVNASDRPHQPLLREEGSERPLSVQEAEQALRDLIEGRPLFGIGSPRASLEANFALRRLVGGEHFSPGFAAEEQRLAHLVLDILRYGPVPVASLARAEQADAVLILGEDVPNTAARLALSLRQAARQAAFDRADALQLPRWQDESVRQAGLGLLTPFIVATPLPTRLDDVATARWHAAPDDLARLGAAIAHLIAPRAPAASGLSEETVQFAQAAADQLRRARRPLVVSGAGCANEAVVQAAANLAWALQEQQRKQRGEAAIALCLAECNSLGSAHLGGRDVDALLRAAMDAGQSALLVVENDLAQRADPALLERLWQSEVRLVALDALAHTTMQKAHLALPAATYSEASGTLVSFEGRAQRFFRVFAPQGPVRESWRWLEMASGRPESTLDGLTAACAATIPGLEAITHAAPEAAHRVFGRKIPREPNRYSGRTAVHADTEIFEPAPPPDPDAPLSHSMEGPAEAAPAALIPFYWAPRWNSVQALNRFQQEVGGPLKGGEPGVRLLHLRPDAKVRYYAPGPPPFRRREGSFLVLPLRRLFGGDPLSAKAPAVAARSSEAELLLNREDARGFSEGDPVVVSCGSWRRTLPLRFASELAPGVAGLPLDLPHLAGLALPAWVQLRRPEEADEHE